jgi:hypothetical protein
MHRAPVSSAASREVIRFGALQSERPWAGELGLPDLEREIERRRRQAKKLGVDHLICRLYFDHLLNYVERSKQREFQLRGITEASRPDSTRLSITVSGQAYSFRVSRESPYPGADDYDEFFKLELYQHDALVFAVDVGGMYGEDGSSYFHPHIVTAFVEGPWIKQFQGLGREAEEASRRRWRREQEDSAVAAAKRFGLDPNDYPTTESARPPELPATTGDARQVAGLLLVLVALLGVASIALIVIWGD